MEKFLGFLLVIYFLWFFVMPVIALILGKSFWKTFAIGLCLSFIGLIMPVFFLLNHIIQFFYIIFSENKKVKSNKTVKFFSKEEISFIKMKDFMFLYFFFSFLFLGRTIILGYYFPTIIFILFHFVLFVFHFLYQKCDEKNIKKNKLFLN